METETLPRFPEIGLFPDFAKSCPIRASLGVLGRKWALLVLRDIALCKDPRFSDILRNNVGLTPRVLAFRLKELEAEGFIRRTRTNDAREVAYDLLDKGRDTLPLLAAFIHFGSKHHADIVFRDGEPRTLEDVFPGSTAAFLRDLVPTPPPAARGKRTARATAKRPRRGSPKG